MSVIFTPWLPGEGLERFLCTSSQTADLLFPIIALSKGLRQEEQEGKKKK